MAHDPHDPIQVVAISPNFAQDHTVLAATGGLTLKLGVMLLFKTTDGGVNWTVASGLLDNNPIYSIVFSPNYAQDQTVYVAGGGGLFVSTDGANTWTTLSSEPAFREPFGSIPRRFATDNIAVRGDQARTIPLRKSTQPWNQLYLVEWLPSG